MKRLLALASIVLFAFLAGQRYVVSGDDGTYIALARSISQGSYRAINVPGEPIQAQYPPLFPLLLVPVAHLPASALGAVRLWASAWSLLAVVAIAILARRRDPRIGILGALPVVVSPFFGIFGTAVLTEGLFLCLSYAVLCRLASTTDRAAIEPGRASQLDLALPLGVAAAWLAKSLGVALAVAVVLHLVGRRRFRQALFTAGIILAAMSPWWAWQAAHSSDYVRGHILQRDIYDPAAGTLDLASLLVERVPLNASRYVGRILPELLLPPFVADLPNVGWPRALKALTGGFLGLVVLVGFWRRWRRDRFGAEELFVVLMSSTFLLHPVYADRYLFLLLPSLVGYIFAAVSDPLLSRRLVVAWGALLVAGCALTLTARTAPEDLAYYEAVDWIKEHAPAESTILARKPTAVWYYTGRKAMGYSATTDLSAWHPGDFVIRDEYTIGIHAARLYVDPVVADSTLFTLAWSSAILPSVRIYARIPAAR